MKRIILLALPFLALGLLLPASSRAANDNWTDIKREFRSKFKTKNALDDRKQAVELMSKSHDVRGVKELLKVVDDQQKHAERLRKEWQMEEDAWEEKTKKLTEIIERRREQAHGGSIKVSDEEDDWLGLTEKYNGPNAKLPKMHTEKMRIMGLYNATLAEEDFVTTIFQSVARLVNSLEGDELSDGADDAANAARRARGDDQIPYIRMLAYIKGEKVTDTLTTYAKDTDPTVAIAALEALGRQNTEPGMLYLIERLDDPRWQVRSAVLKGLAYFHDPRVMDALLAGAQKEEGVLKRKYFTAMARIVNEQVPGTYEAWKSYWDANKDDLIAQWKQIYPLGEPVVGELPDVPIDTNLGSMSFYGIQSTSKHVIFVVDVSGSMSAEQGQHETTGDAPIDIARKELKRAIQTLSSSGEDERGEASFNIVIYSDYPKAYADGKMVDATQKNKDKAFEWIDENVKAEGMTNIYDSIEMAFNIISGSSDKKNMKKGADTIYIMTDGAPNRGKFYDLKDPRQEILLREVRRLNETRKITIHAIAIGPGANTIFLNMLAAQNDGQFKAR